MANRVVLPKQFKDIFKPYRYKIVYGGRGSTKSHSIAQALLLIASQQTTRVLCVREFQNSIKESCHLLLCDYIEKMGLSWFYDTTNNKITGLNGSEFIFRGIKNNPHSIKSLEGVNIAWVEEGQTISRASLKILIPTIRELNSELWFSMNPENDDDPVYELIKKPPPRCLLININYLDTPFCPPDLIEEAEYLKATDYEAYEHVWLGKTKTVSDAIVFNRKFVVEAFNPLVTWSGPYYGSDFGFSADPTTLVRCWVFERRLYIEREVVGHGVDTHNLPDLYSSDPNSKQYVIRADCSRPETISYLKQHGYPLTTACKKWNGSINDGISYMRGFDKIVIHPNCKYTQNEFRKYSYKTDKITGDIQNIIVDANNHCIDAIRYALEPLITQKRPGSISINR